MINPFNRVSPDSVSRKLARLRHGARAACKRLREERDEARTKYRWMVEHAADQKLDGYRELGARAATAENQRDAARKDRDDFEAGYAVFHACVSGLVATMGGAQLDMGDEELREAARALVAAIILERDAARLELRARQWLDDWEREYPAGASRSVEWSGDKLRVKQSGHLIGYFDDHGHAARALGWEG